MAAFNFKEKVFTTEGHGQNHVEEVCDQHGLTVDWQETATTPEGTVRGDDGILYLAHTVEYGANGEIVSGQWFNTIW